VIDAVAKRMLRRSFDALGRIAGADAPGACVRLCAGRADGCDGLIVDKLGSLIVATDYRPADRPGGPDGEADPAEGLLAAVQELHGDAPIVARARTPQGGTDSFSCARAWPGGAERAAPGLIVGLERGLRFEIGTDPAHDFGLFLDAAKARQHVRSIARGLDVLNLFSYTAAFGVAAAVGGARSVTNVDPNRDYLAWGLRNGALNQVGLRVLPDTAQDFLARHARRMARAPDRRGFDLIIVDPPAFGVGRGRARLMRLLWPELFAAVRTMRPAEVLLLCNDKYLRARRSFVDLVDEELGADYAFTRLGTCLTLAEIAAAEPPPLAWTAARLEDPHYLEPVVLAGRRRSAAA
jgi:23S rRNA (cytosine1962-C5)-methyltransferase